MNERPHEALAFFEQRRRFRLMLIVRMAVLTALAASTVLFNLPAFLLALSRTQILLYATVLVAYLITAGYSLGLWLRREWSPGAIHIQVNIVTDVLVATVLVYVTGGVESPFSFVYALPIIVTAVFNPRVGTFLTAGLCSLLLGSLFVLQSQGFLPASLENQNQVPPGGGRVVYLLALNFTVFFTVAWLARYLGEQLVRASRKLRWTEGELQALAILNRDIVLSLRSGLLVIDWQGTVQLLNPVGEEILGVSIRQAVGQGAASVFPSLLPWLEASPAPGQGMYHRVEVEHARARDGKTIPVGLTLSTLRSPDGADAGILVHMQDLTEHRKMEASIKRAEKLAALGTMAAGLAHEIRNPLAAISGSVQVLKAEREVSGEEQRLMDIVLRETGRLESLLTDFLAFARPREPQMRPVDLGEQLQETVAVFAHGLGEEGPRVFCEAAAVRVNVDPDQIRQVLWNLLVNAAAATSAQGEIRVRIAPNGDNWAVVEVADNGPGIPEDIRDKIFEPFFTTRSQGHGLGLATVSRIVEAHRGTIQVQCPAEGGSVITIRLPGVRDE